MSCAMIYSSTSEKREIGLYDILTTELLLKQSCFSPGKQHGSPYHHQSRYTIITIITSTAMREKGKLDALIFQHWYFSHNYNILVLTQTSEAKAHTTSTKEHGLAWASL